MSAINFPDPSQSPWTNSSTGITYTYSNGVWKALSSEETFLKESDAESTYLKQADANFVSLSDGGTQQVISGGGGLNVDGDVQKKGNTVPSAVMGATAPSNPGICDFWTDTSGDDPVLKSWNGTEWVEVGSSTPSEISPVISNVTLTENDTTGDRFTSQTFDVDITMLREGEPFSQKGLKGEVTAEFAQYPVYEPVASNAVTYASSNQSPAVNTSYYGGYGFRPIAYGPINSTQYGFVWLNHNDSGDMGKVNVKVSSNLSDWASGGAIVYQPNGSIYGLHTNAHGQYFPPATSGSNGYYIFYQSTNGLNHTSSQENKNALITVSPSGDISGLTSIYRMGKTVEHNGKYYFLDHNLYARHSDTPISGDASEVMAGAVSSYGKQAAPIGIANGYFVWFYWTGSSTLRSARLPVNWTAGQAPELTTIMTNDTNDISAYGVAGGYFWLVKNRTIFRSSNGQTWSNLGELGNTGAGQYYYISGLRENPDTGAAEFIVYYNGDTYLYSTINGGGSWQVIWQFNSYTPTHIDFFNGQMILKKHGSTRYLKAWPWGGQTVTLEGQGADYSSLNVNDTVHPLNNYDANAYGRISAISGNNITIDSGYIYQVGDVIEGFNAISSGVTSRYLVIDATGAVSGTVGSDPGYVEIGPNTSKTLTFPATFPSGNAPDAELPVGTTLKVSVQATNSIGSSEFGPSNIITPA